MKITKSQLKRIIKEELESVFAERLGWRPGDPETFASWEAAREADATSARGRKEGKPIKHSSSWQSAVARASGEGDFQPLEGGHEWDFAGVKYARALERSAEEQDEELLARGEQESHPDPEVEAERERGRKRARRQARRRVRLELRKQKRL